VPQLDFSTFAPQIIWLALIFSAFYFLVSRVFAPKISSQVNERIDFIDKELATAAAARDAAATATAGHEAALLKAREIASNEIGSAKFAASKSFDEKLKNVENALGQRLAGAEVRISSLKQTSLASLEASVDELAQQMFKKITGTTAA
jgi:F-type H+-transporting ATPase subunit b